MLPPVDGHVLAANPKFEALYRDLCANKLNEDGSSRLDAKALKEKQVAEEVSRCPIHVPRTHRFEGVRNPFGSTHAFLFSLLRRCFSLLLLLPA